MPDVQAAMMELRIKYEVEKAQRETLEAVIARYPQVGGEALPRMENLSGSEVSYCNSNPQGSQAVTPTQNEVVQGQAEVVGVQGQIRENPRGPLVHLSESSPLPPRLNEQPSAIPAVHLNRKRNASNCSQESQASSVALTHASLSSNTTRKYKMKSPRIFKGATTPEEFDKFIRLSQLHLKSHDCKDKIEWVEILEG
ncbi:MAG: hypothetical protein GY696_00740, partial [Gammaproteobacteria bacterium]|nr:hypothetical protein [Gammaproteobacteria bacterium]